MGVVDYVALICSERESRRPVIDREPLIDGKALDRIDGLARQILALTDLHLSAGGPDTDAFEQVRRRMVRRRMYVQGPGFEFQESELIEALFGDEQTERDLIAAIGFSAADALQINEAIIEVSLRKLEERSRDGRALPTLLERELQDAGPLLEKLKLSDMLPQLPPRERARWLKEFGQAFTFLALGTTMQVSIQEVADATGIEAARVGAFFEEFSTPFGQSHTSSLGTEVLRIRRRPLLDDGDGQFLLSSHIALHWALRPGLEQALKENHRVWTAFDRRRSRVVESKTLDCLARALPGSQSYPGATFELEEDGEKRRYEIDGLIVCDTIMLTVECKAGSLTPAGERGAPGRVSKRLRDLLVSAATQADRARRALERDDPCFVSAEGTKIRLPDQVSEVFPIVVTLQDLSEVTTTIWELEKAGLLPESVATPWALSLFELELISDLTEYAAMLIHFLRRRSRLNVLKRVDASDELDWWMYYLERGLYFDRQLEGPESPDVIHLMSMTDPLDAYYLFTRGQRTKPAKKPRQRLPRELRALLDCLNERKLAGYIEASVALLELDDKAREELLRGYRRLRETTASDGEWHNLSLLVAREASFGITFMTAPGANLDQLEQRLGQYSVAKKYQSQLRKWVAFGWCEETPGLLDLVGVFIGDWRPDSFLDERLDEMGLDPTKPVEPRDTAGPLRPPRAAVRPPPRRKSAS